MEQSTCTDAVSTRRRTRPPPLAQAPTGCKVARQRGLAGGRAKHTAGDAAAGLMKPLHARAWKQDLLHATCGHNGSHEVASASNCDRHCTGTAKPRGNSVDIAVRGGNKTRHFFERPERPVPTTSGTDVTHTCGERAAQHREPYLGEVGSETANSSASSSPAEQPCRKATVTSTISSLVAISFATQPRAGAWFGGTRSTCFGEGSTTMANVSTHAPSTNAHTTADTNERITEDSGEQNPEPTLAVPTSGEVRHADVTRWPCRSVASTTNCQKCSFTQPAGLAQFGRARDS